MTPSEQYLIGAFIVFLTQIVILFQNRKQNTKLEQIHIIMNSRLDQLVKSSNTAARLEGHAEGLAQGGK